MYRQCTQSRGSNGSSQSPKDRPHWSYSQVSQFLRCPLSYYFDRIAKLPKPFISSGLALGATVHHTLAEIHRNIQDGKNLGSEEVRNVLMAAWEEMENREPIQYRDGEDRAKSVDQAVALLDLYLKEPTPACVVAVEEPLLVPLQQSGRGPGEATVGYPRSDHSGTWGTDRHRVQNQWTPLWRVGNGCLSPGQLLCPCSPRSV